MIKKEFKLPILSRRNRCINIKGLDSLLGERGLKGLKGIQSETRITNNTNSIWECKFEGILLWDVRM